MSNIFENEADQAEFDDKKERINLQDLISMNNELIVENQAKDHAIYLKRTELRQIRMAILEQTELSSIEQQTSCDEVQYRIKLIQRDVEHLELQKKR
jgi:hypothetical protein